MPVFGVLLVNLGSTLSFWSSQSIKLINENLGNFKIYGNVENKKTVINKILYVKILLKQNQISKQIISKYRKCTLDSNLVAYIENIFSFL